MDHLALFSSPREQGFSAQLHHCFCDSLEQRGLTVKKVQVYNLDLSPCTACGHCSDNPECSIDDDMTPLYEALVQASVISISAPVYFSSLPAPLKMFIDRCQVLWEEPYGKRFSHVKTGFFMATGGSEPYGTMFSPSIAVIKHFFNTINASFNEKDFICLSGTDTMSKLAHDHCFQARDAGEKLELYSE